MKMSAALAVDVAADDCMHIYSHAGHALIRRGLNGQLVARYNAFLLGLLT